ncbi:MAG: hypothetical protein ABI889_10110 [Gemmatimonadota bacterium]
MLALGCATARAPAVRDATVQGQITIAIDSLAAAMESLQPDRMLAAWAPGSDVLHVSNTNVVRIDTLLPSLYPVWHSRRAFKVTWTMRALRALGPSAAVATTSVRFVATDTLGVTTTRDGVWTMVFAESAGVWKIVADHRTMEAVPENGSR